MTYAMSNFWKRKAGKGKLWFRFILGFLIFLISLGFGYLFIWLPRNA
jgi:hypothetical protein